VPSTLVTFCRFIKVLYAIRVKGQVGHNVELGLTPGQGARRSRLEGAVSACGESMPFLGTRCHVTRRGSRSYIAWVSCVLSVPGFDR
jgi:hypothetical protein